MISPLSTPAPESRAETLKAANRPAHEALDQRIMSARPFDDAHRYARFVMMQQALHHDAEPVYGNADLARCFGDLARLSRLQAVLLDGDDLGVPLDLAGRIPFCAGMDLPESLGWLYVIQGSNLGAAFLAKAARRIGFSETRGARHLAEDPAGRAGQWRDFRLALDRVTLPPEDEARVIAGANSAFGRARELVERYMS